MMWFTHNDIDSRHYGVFLTEQPLILRAERRVSFTQVPGRSGSVPKYDGAYNDIETDLACYIADVSMMADAFAWLAEEGDLILSTDQTRAYHAQVIGEPEIERITRGMAARNFRITMRLEPFRYHYPASSPVTISLSGGTIYNPGTHASRPRIAITGDGDFTVTVGGEVMEFAGITDGVIVDSEMRDCLTADASALANDYATMDEYPTLPVGSSAITWTGSVTAVEITPRWCDL